jgi:hypothetical protein
MVSRPSLRKTRTTSLESYASGLGGGVVVDVSLGPNGLLTIACTGWACEADHSVEFEYWKDPVHVPGNAATRSVNLKSVKTMDM